MKISNIIEQELVFPEIKTDSAEDSLKLIISTLREKKMITDGQVILKKLIEREKLASTSIGNRTAIPHAKVKDLKKPIVVIAISKKGIKYHQNDDEPVNLIALILSPANSPALHLQILAAMASLIKKNGSVIKNIINAESAVKIIEIIKKSEEEDD